MNLKQPTVSAHIQALEKELGVRRTSNYGRCINCAGPVYTSVKLLSDARRKILPKKKWGGEHS